MKIYLYLSLLLFFSLPLISQDKEKVEALKKLGRDSLIQLALKKLNDPAFDPNVYDRVIVEADGNTNTIRVRFELSVVFKKGCYYDAVSVSLVGGGTGKSIEGDCDEPAYYKPSATIQKNIDFVFNAINKENDVGNIPDKKLSDDEKMEITEKGSYYYVEFSSWSTYSHYKIDKSNGKIYDAGHKHYARDEDERKNIEIIK
ncbi:MAG TPA: hypothetical protein VGF30_08325 [Bacteroidia bacterium]